MVVARNKFTLQKEHHKLIMLHIFLVCGLILSCFGKLTIHFDKASICNSYSNMIQDNSQSCLASSRVRPEDLLFQPDRKTLRQLINRNHTCPKVVPTMALVHYLYLAIWINNQLWNFSYRWLKRFMCQCNKQQGVKSIKFLTFFSSTSSKITFALATSN